MENNANKKRAIFNIIILIISFLIGYILLYVNDNSRPMDDRLKKVEQDIDELYLRYDSLKNDQKS